MNENNDPLILSIEIINDQPKRKLQNMKQQLTINESAIMINQCNTQKQL